MSLTRNLSTKENREYWEFVRKTAEKVDSWPAWKAGLHDPARPNATIGEILGRAVPQSQAALTDQLIEAARLAERHGLYDAADWIRGADETRQLAADPEFRKIADSAIEEFKNQ